MAVGGCFDFVLCFGLGCSVGRCFVFCCFEILGGFRNGLKVWGGGYRM